jgi:hypothetical protein
MVRDGGSERVNVDIPTPAPPRRGTAERVKRGGGAVDGMDEVDGGEGGIADWRFEISEGTARMENGVSNGLRQLRKRHVKRGKLALQADRMGYGKRTLQVECGRRARRSRPTNGRADTARTSRRDVPTNGQRSAIAVTGRGGQPGRTRKDALPQDEARFAAPKRIRGRKRGYTGFAHYAAGRGVVGSVEFALVRVGGGGGQTTREWTRRPGQNSGDRRQETGDG